MRAIVGVGISFEPLRYRISIHDDFAMAMTLDGEM